VDPDSARASFLESLVQKELLVLEAKARGYYTDSLVLRGTARYTDKLLQERVKLDEAQIDSVCTESQIQAEFQRSLTERKMAHIMHWSAASIDTARRRIDAGEPFEQVATAMTIDAQGAEVGGVLPWLNDTVLFDEFRVILDTLRVGGIAGPFKSRLGWHLVRLDSVRTREGADLADERDKVQKALVGERSRDSRQRTLDGYRQRYQLRLDTTATVETVTQAEADYMFAAGDTSMIGVPMSGRWIPRDSTRVLARYAGGTITTVDYRWLLLEGGYIALYGRLGPAQAINDVSELFFQRARLNEAQKKGYDRDPELKRRVDLKHEELAVDRLYAAAVASKISYTDTDEKIYYAAHKDQFPRKEFYRCAHIDVDDASVAQGIVDRIAGLDAAGFDSLKAEVERTGHLVRAFRDSGRRGSRLIGPGAVKPVAGGAAGEPAEVEEDPALVAARTMKPEEVGHVVEKDGVHSVFVLIEYQPAGDQTFEEAQQNVQRTLHNLQSEEHLTALLTEIEARYPVERYPERLRSPRG
jgi:hypothetical protein